MTFEFPQYTGVKIGDCHTLDDWGLLLLSVDIPYPEPKTRTVELLGGDGNIDLTDALGGVKFNNRTVGFEFVLIDKSPLVWLETTSIIRNYCHGKKMKVIMDTDPSHYWEGRIFVTSTKEDQIHSVVKIEADAFPYKYDVLSSEDPWLWDPFSFLSGVIRTIGVLDITAQNNKVKIPSGTMPTVPVFNVSDMTQEMKVSYDSRLFSLRQGINRFPQIVVGGEKEVELIFSGSGKVQISYRGGSL